MALYEVIPTDILSHNNELASDMLMPALARLNDPATTVLIDFAKISPRTVAPTTSIDLALQYVKVLPLQVLLIESHGHILGLVSQEELLSEEPIRLMHTKNLARSEITVEMLMVPETEILTIDIKNLKNAKVGHVISTIKQHAANYILVVKKYPQDKHVIKGIFAATQIGKQLHTDVDSMVNKPPETIVDLHRERKS